MGDGIRYGDGLPIECQLFASVMMHSFLLPHSQHFLYSETLLSGKAMRNSRCERYDIGRKSGNHYSSTSSLPTLTYGQRISHISSNTPGFGFGTGIEFELEDAGGGMDVMGSIASRFLSSTAGQEKGYLSFYTADIVDDGLAERMRIDHNGYMGIGVTSPQRSLDVLGQIGGGTFRINPLQHS